MITNYAKKFKFRQITKYKKTMKFIIVIFAISLGRKVEPDENGNYFIKKKLDGETFNFLMLGDWGGYRPPVGAKFLLTIFIFDQNYLLFFTMFD